jgi:hypothetical protein
MRTPIQTPESRGSNSLRCLPPLTIRANSGTGMAVEEIPFALLVSTLTCAVVGTRSQQAVPLLNDVVVVRNVARSRVFERGTTGSKPAREPRCRCQRGWPRRDDGARLGSGASGRLGAAGPSFGNLVHLRYGKLSVLADVSGYERFHNPDGGAFDSTHSGCLLFPTGAGSLPRPEAMTCFASEPTTRSRWSRSSRRARSDQRTRYRPGSPRVRAAASMSAS